MIRVIGFDLDGTLTPTTHHYDIARWQCGTVIAECLQEHCPKAEYILKLQQQIDRDMMPSWKYSLGRFPTSWVRVYEQVTKEAGQSVDDAIAQKLVHLASQFQVGPFKLYPGTRQVLELLASAYELHLVTMGLPSFQLDKVDQLGIGHFFASIHPVEEHKEDALASIFNGRAETCVMVGDGRTSDLGPAQRLGAKTIWIQRPNTWELHDSDSVTPDITIRDIQELPAAIHQLDNIL